MKDLDTVRLGSGIDSINFGCFAETVRDVLGTPDEETKDEYGDLELEYCDLGIRFTFWCDFDHRLGCVSTERKGAKILGKKLMGESEESIKCFIAESLNGKVKEYKSCVHEDGDLQSWIETDQGELTFWFQNGKLYLIDWFCNWVDEETPDWVH